MAHVIVDTEYTTWEDALRTGWGGAGQHREIVQIAAVRVDDDFKEIASFDVIVKPSVNTQVSAFFTGLTGITQARIDAEGTDFADAMMAFFQFTGDGAESVICMNADEMVMRENCRLNGRAFPFRYAFHRLRPFIESLGIETRGLSSGDLHALTPHPLAGHAHNALHDVRSMATWLAHEKSTGSLNSLAQLPSVPPETDPRIDEARAASDVGLAYRPSEEAIRAAGRILDKAGRFHGWFPKGLPTWEETEATDPIGYREFAGLIQQMLDAAHAAEAGREA